MFSGNDSSESQNYTQWALNPSAYQNVQNEQIDWAALAHQWIKMKEAGPPIPTDKVLPMPPPPIISKTTSNPTKPESHKLLEGGEAPMDVENDYDSSQCSDSNDSGNWSKGQKSGSWRWNMTSVTNVAWPPTIQTMPSNKTPLLPTPAFSSFNIEKEDSYSNVQWSGNGCPGGSSIMQPKLLKPHNKRFSKINVPLVKSMAPQSTTAQTTPTIDANNRKQLPAWIREGLEKMERDKMKQMDRTHRHDPSEDAERKKRLRENALEILKSTACQNEIKPINVYNDDSNEEDINTDEESNNKPIPPPAPQITQQASVPLTHEEMMLNVRRTMTEILLKVTNREIAQICKEEHQRHLRRKATDQHVTAPSAGANLSARLGLGAYEGSDDSSNESDDADGTKNEQDSDNDLMDVIKRRKEEFAKTEKEIESRLKEAEVNNSKTRESSDRDSSPGDQGDRSLTPKPNRRNTKSSNRRRDRNLSSSRSSSSSSSSDRRSPRRSGRHRSRSSSRSEDYNRSRSSKRIPSSSRSSHRRSRSRSRSRRASKRRSRYSPVHSKSPRSNSYRRRRRSKSRSPRYSSRRRSNSSRRRSRSFHSRSRSRSIDSRGAPCT